MAEQLVNEFTVNRPIDEAWPIICDLEQIAPCMPGAQLEEIEGETHRGKVKVKLGAITAEFKGEAVITARDDVAHTATTELHITGKVAQFGRGIMGDVSKKLMDHFADNLNTMLDEQGSMAGDEPAPDEPVAEVAPEPTPAAPAEPTTVRKIEGPAAEPIDLGGLAGPALLKRIGPLIAALVVVLIILRKRK
jgi:carbon monoxide dehydrogenase subunit G